MERDARWVDVKASIHPYEPSGSELITGVREDLTEITIVVPIWDRKVKSRILVDDSELTKAVGGRWNVLSTVLDEMVYQLDKELDFGQKIIKE